MEKTNVTLMDRETGEFSDKALGAKLTGAFNVNNFRPFIAPEDGKQYVSVQNDKGEMVARPFIANSIVNNAVLMRDEWIAIDRVVQKIARERLVGAADLLSRGLVYPLNNPMGKTILEYQDMNDPGVAQIDMDAATQGENDRPDFTTKYLPIPIIHSDFTIGQRVLEASRTYGDPLDVTMAEACTRRVTEKLEDMIFTNTTFVHGGGTIYSYISDLNKNTVTLTENWDASGKTGAEIKDDLLAMKQKMIAAKHFGPFAVYIPTAYETVLDDDYVSGYPKTIRTRLLEISNIDSIKVADHLPANTVVMVEMISSTVRLVNGFTPTVVQWSTMGGLMHHFKVMSIQVIQTRADQDGNSGICVLAA